MPKLSQANHSIEKVLSIIETMSVGGKMRLQDIAELTQLPPSTALRMLRTLLSRGYVTQDPETYKYFLTLKFAQIGSAISAKLGIFDVAHPWLERLSSVCRDACCLGIEEAGEVVYVDVIDGPEGLLKVTQRIGKRAPMHCTGIGKMLLLERTPEQLKEFVSQRELQRFTVNTLTSLPELEQELDKIRGLGYALDDEECELGARCIAAGVRDHSGKIVAGISISGTSHRMPDHHIAEIKGPLLEAAMAVSIDLGYKPTSST